MNYGYKGVKLGDLIKKYEKDFRDNTIKITFLDGSSYIVPLTYENEQAILDKMLEQAQQRSESKALQNAIQKRRIDFPLLVMKVSALMLNSANYSVANSKESKVIYSVLGGLIAVTIALNGVEIKFTSNEINELKKYDIYLAIKEKLEKNEYNCNNFNGIKECLGTLNINTLDNYSLKEIRRIKANLDKGEKWVPYFESNKQKVLVKKRGK